MSFIAEYHGSCADCGSEMKNARVTYGHHGLLVHVVCPDPTTRLVPDDVSMGDGTVCPRCFCYHAGEC